MVQVRVLKKLGTPAEAANLTDFSTESFDKIFSLWNGNVFVETDKVKEVDPAEYLNSEKVRSIVLKRSRNPTFQYKMAVGDTDVRIVKNEAVKLDEYFGQEWAEGDTINLIMKGLLKEKKINARSKWNQLTGTNRSRARKLFGDNNFWSAVRYIEILGIKDADEAFKRWKSDGMPKYTSKNLFENVSGSNKNREISYEKIVYVSKQENTNDKWVARFGDNVGIKSVKGGYEIVGRVVRTAFSVNCIEIELDKSQFKYNMPMKLNKKDFQIEVAHNRIKVYPKLNVLWKRGSNGYWQTEKEGVYLEYKESPNSVIIRKV